MPRFATPRRKRYFFGVLSGIVVGFFCFIPAVEFIVAHQLAQRSVSVNRVDFLPLSMSLKLYGVEYFGNRRQLYLDEVQFRPSSRFWEQGKLSSVRSRYFGRFRSHSKGGQLKGERRWESSLIRPLPTFRNQIKLGRNSSCLEME